LLQICGRHWLRVDPDPPNAAREPVRRRNAAGLVHGRFAVLADIGTLIRREDAPHAPARRRARRAVDGQLTIAARRSPAAQIISSVRWKPIAIS
jgi:hypothetical protein